MTKGILRLAAIGLLSASLSTVIASEPGAIDFPALDDQAIPDCLPLLNTDFAFASSADGDSEIYLYHAGSRSIEKLTDNDVQDHWPSWSPDGSRLAYQSLRDGNREVYVLDLRLGETRNLTNNAGQDLLPSWSPDGEHIAFQSSRGRTWTGDGPLGGNIFLLSLSNGETRQLPIAPFESTSTILWAPDGRSIAYARFGTASAGLYIFDFDTRQERKLAVPGLGSVGVAAFSADGLSLLYYQEHANGADLFQLALAEGSTHQVPGEGGYHYYAAWSVDGDFLLTTSSQDETGQRYDIRCRTLDGSTNVNVIGDASDARSAAWRPSR